MNKWPAIILSISLLLASFLLSSCGETYQKVLKSTDFDYKYEKAMEYYEKEDYHKAIPLLEELRSLHIGVKDVEKINFLYAYAHYYQKDYLMAAYYFKGFTEYYPKSVYVEECEFMVGYCYYEMAPKPELEQTYTLRAIDGLQLYVNAYPYGEYVERSNTLMDELRKKLEDKAYINANLYYKIRNYKAAINALQNVLKDFPETNRKEEIYYQIFKSNYLLAQRSIESKKEERFNNTVTAYYQLLDKYPSSKYIKEAERIYDACSKNLAKLQTNE